MSSRRKELKRAARKRWLVVATLVVVVALVAALAVVRLRYVSPDALVARAAQQFSAGEYAAATIDLKNVVRSDPANRDARLLLGRTYLKTGNAAGAVKELVKARELGLVDTELDLAMVRALILTAKYDEAATEIARHGDTSEADWLILRGMLDLAQQRLPEARATFSGVLEHFPDNVEARRGLMQAELAAGDTARARSEVEKLLSSGPGDPMLWVVKGELDLHDDKAQQARAAFEQALKLAPTNALAILGMAQAHLALGELHQASMRLDALGHGDTDDPRINYLRARIAAQQGDNSSALASLRKVLQVSPMHRESLVMAATLNFSLGEYSRAQDFVARLLELDPNNESAKRMLGTIQLASGRLEGLNELGAAADSQSIQDPGMLALLGTAYLKHGKFADSEASLERAAALAPGSLPIRTQLALSKLSGGHVEDAITDLQAIVATDPDFAQADIMLALAYLSRKDNAQARAVSAALVSKHSEDALAHNVNGYVLEMSGDKAAARAEYEAALSRDQAFHPARINLARLALQDGDREAGRKYFEGVISRDRFNAFALLGLAALALEQNQLDQAEKLWLLARDNNPESVAPRLLLAKHYRAKNNLTSAATMIKEAYALAPFAAQVQAEYASIMLQNGSYQEALKAAQALTTRVPDSLQGLELLARVYNQLGDEGGLTATLKRIADKAPTDASAQVLLGRLALRRKDYAEAQRIVERLLQQPDNVSAGHELQGDVALARENPEAALAAYTRAYDTTPTSANVLKLDRTERDLGRGGTRLLDWLKLHPDDLQVRLVHTSYLQQEGAGNDAIAQYEGMLADHDNNPIVLNNLAWLYHERQDKRALDLARRASELAPRQAEIVDTYGWILLAQSQLEQGLEVLTKAAQLSPQNPDIAYHVASALAQSGMTKEAQAQLKKLLQEHPQFNLRKAAEALSAKLGAE